MSKLYKSYMLSADGKSFEPVFDGDSYNTLDDIPIKNLYSNSQEVYIDVGSLPQGEYRIHGYYKIDDNAELQHSDDNKPLSVSVQEDPENPTKKYAVINTVSADKYGQTIYTIQGSAITATHEVGVDDSIIPEINDTIDQLGQNLEDSVSELNITISSEVSSINNRIDSEVATLNNTIDQLGQDLENSVSELDTTISSEVSTINDRIDNEVVTLNDTISTESSSISDRIDSEVTTLNDTISTESSSINDRIDDEVTTLNNKINTEVNTINNSLTAHSQSLSTLDSQVAVIDSRLDSHDQSISEINDTLADFDDNFTLLNNTESTTGSVRQIAKSYTDSLDNQLATVAKSGASTNVSVQDLADNFESSNVEATLAELATMINDAETSGVVALSRASQPDQGDSSTYILTQGGIERGRIHLAKDLVATSGELVDEDGNGNSGAFIKMVIANGEPFYIPVQGLIDIYQGSGDVGNVNTGIEINVNEGIISATIHTVNGENIDDKTIAFTKFTQTVQDKINHIDDAVFSVTEGATNGTISVDGTDTPVHGLGSAAYQNVSAFDASGDAETVRTQLMGNAQTDTSESKTIEGLVKKTTLTSNTLANLDTYVGTIPTGSTSTNVVDYVSEVKNSVSGSATIANKSGNAVTLKAGLTQTNSAISNNSSADITLADVASTGKASDISIIDAGNLLTATNVEGALAEISDKISNIDSVVRYDTAQTKTDLEKTQARSNIGAASNDDVTAAINNLTQYLVWHTNS